MPDAMNRAGDRVEERGGGRPVSRALELTDASRERIRELQDLSSRAENGEAGARRELRRAVRESAPEVIARCSNIARTYRWVAADTASGRDPLVREAIVERASRMVYEIAGANASPLEVLLAEQIASLWVLTETQEAALCAYYSPEQAKRLDPAFIIQMCRIQEVTNRRYLAAMKTLAQVRKAQASTPALHLTQINVS
jgi:hypothetical protein